MAAAGQPFAADGSLLSGTGKLGRVRPLTVDQALQYSPLSTIVPFGPEIIPLPTIRSSSSTSLFALPQESTEAAQTLEDLNERLLKDPAQAYARHAIEELKGVLESQDRTQYQFKHLARPQLLNGPGSSLGLMKIPEASASALGKFAETVLNSTEVTFRYPSPTTPNSKVETAQPASPQRLAASNGQGAGPIQNGVSESHSLLTPKSASKVPIVVLPEKPASFRREDYADYRLKRKKPATSGLSRKKEPHQVKQAQLTSTAPDQKAKSDVSMRTLQDLIGSIFEAEDQLQPDTSGAISTDATGYFVDGSWAEGKIATVSPAIHVKLESFIKRVISDGRFVELPSDDLVRLQKLCEGSVINAESVDLRVQEEWSEDEIQNWLQQVEIAELGLKASRTILRIMTGGREEKQLYSEETLQSVLNVLKSALDTGVIPAVETRSSGASAQAFKLLSSHKKLISGLLSQAVKLLRLLADLLVKVDVTEGVITSFEFVATGLIFVENAQYDKDSILGVQKFEPLRVTAMNILVKVFSRHPDQRSFIIDEILTSLERLPVTRQAARHFKLVEGGNIQLVSALLMRLVQTTAIKSTDKTPGQKRKPSKSLDQSDGVDDSDSNDEENAEPLVTVRVEINNFETEQAAERQPQEAINRLHELSEPLLDGAQKVAHHVIHFLVSRALKSTKTGDDPYRILLDIFTEDLITVLDSTDWPAAELLLRILLRSMVGISEGDKSSAPAKNMALDLMGLMGSAICDMVAQLRQSSKNRDSSCSGLDGYLAGLAEGFLEDRTRDIDLLSWDGPYRATIELLQQRDLNDGQIESARGYYTCQWASRICAAFDSEDHLNDKEEKLNGARLGYRLRCMMTDPKWLETNYEFDIVSATQGRLAYVLTVLNMPFCKAFERILLILLNSMNSEQATVRSKSMKSIIQLLEKDPTILDRSAHVIRSIQQRTYDPSPLVRDSAVGLVGKCLALKPDLEEKVWKDVLSRVQDAQVGVRKRSMKILKGIYLRNVKKEMKSAIADALLHRLKDTDDSVAELARILFEEIWITPFHDAENMERDSIQRRLALKEQVYLIVKTVQRGESVSAVLETLLQNVLSKDKEAKLVAANLQVCESMVSIMFDEILEEEEHTDKPSRSQTLQTLTVFAKSNADLFNADHLELLQPYLGHLSKSDDLHAYRSIVTIYRWVIPHLPGLKTTFLNTVQGALLSNLSKLSKRELNEVIPCLWTINGVLKNMERLSRVTISCARGVYAERSKDFSDANPKRNELIAKVTKYMAIAGLFGKYCDFGSEVARFKAQFPWWKGDSVPGLLITIFKPFTEPQQPKGVRSAALDGMGAICQSWSTEFLKGQVNTAYQSVFQEGDKDLQNLVLQCFKGLFVLEEQRSASRAEVPADTSKSKSPRSERLDHSMVATQNDGVINSIAQHYLDDILRIATATQDGFALQALEVLASICRQGTLHPRRYGPVLIALETSQNPVIANMAYVEHKVLHQKHESIFEKEYVKAIQQTFDYQTTVVHDAAGFIGQPPTSKLRPMFDVLKISKIKYRNKFLSNLCNKVDFDPGKLDVTADVPVHLKFSRFVAENIAFFEYSTVAEVLHVILCIEQLVCGTGTSVAHTIETEILQVGLEPQPDQLGALNPGSRAVDDRRLKQLTTSCMILSIMWEVRTYIRRVYGFASGGASKRDMKAKSSSKELAKTPIKIPSISADKLVEEIKKIMGALVDSDSMMRRCRAFVELLTVDDELKIAAEGDDELMVRAETPSEDEGEGTPAPPSGSGRNRKRKAVGEFPGGKKAKKKGRQSITHTKTGSDEDAHEVEPDGDGEYDNHDWV